MRNHLHPFMNQRTCWNNVKPFHGSNGWVSNFGMWCGSRSRVNGGLKPWTGVGESGASQRFPDRIISHICVEKNAPWMGPHLRRKLVMIFGDGIERESSK